MENSVTQEELKIELLLLPIKRNQLRWSGICSRYLLGASFERFWSCVPLEGGHEEDAERTATLDFKKNPGHSTRLSWIL